MINTRCRIPKAFGLFSIILLLSSVGAAQLIAPQLITPHGKHFDRVVIVVLENQNFTSAMKDPFLSDLAKRGTLLTNFRNLYHPSLPNYIAMIAGNAFGVHSDSNIDFPDDDQHKTIGDMLSWRNYAENYPGDNAKPFLDARSGRYARKHVPFLSFQKIQKNSFANVVPVDTKDESNAFVTAIGNFRSDPTKNPLPQYIFYSPNLDDDGHDPVLKPRAGLLKASHWLEKFLKDWLPMDDPAMKGTLLVVTFDESEHDEQDDRIYTVLLGDMVKKGQVDTEYNHFSVLKTIEENFGLDPLSDGDRHAKAISGVWR